MRLLRWLDRKGEDVVGLVLYLYIAIVMFAEVVSRYFFNRSSAWGEETAVYAFIWLAYLAAAGPARQRMHLNFDFLVGRLRGRAKTAALLLADACFLGLALIMVITSIPPVRDALDYGLVMKGIDLPMALASLAIPVGWALIALRIVQRAIILLRDGPPASAHSIAQAGN